jgi:hypothetical protein
MGKRPGAKYVVVQRLEVSHRLGHNRIDIIFGHYLR